MKRSIDERRITICENKRRLGGSSIAAGEDTIAEIFLWLPVKSLLNFKALSKRWSYLISNPDSFFRIHFLSTMGIRTRNRIVGRSDDDYSHHPIMLGYIIQKLSPHILGHHYKRDLPGHVQVRCHEKDYEKPRYVAETSGELDLQHRPAAACKPCPFSLDHGPTDFLLHHLPPDQWRDIHVVASSNGFLLCSLGRRDDPRYFHLHHYLLANPITKEWAFLPEPKAIGQTRAASLSCRGEYPFLALVEYTVVRLVKTDSSVNFFLEVLSSGDDQWTKIDLNTIFGPTTFRISQSEKTVVISTRNKEGLRGITAYCLVGNVRSDTPILLCVDLMPTNNELRDGKGKIQRMKMIKLPRENHYIENKTHHLEQVDGAVHYVRFYGDSLESTRLHVWVLADDNEECIWLLKHKINMGNMIPLAPWPKYQWPKVYVEYFHPLDPKSILLTISERKFWCNVETETLEELSAEEDFVKPGFVHAAYFHYAYQWPCWPPLL